MSKNLVRMVAFAFCLACVAGTFVQAKDAKGGKGGAGAGAAKKGKIVAIDGDTLKIELAQAAPKKKGEDAPEPAATPETVEIKIGDKTQLAAAKPVKLTDVKGEQWANVMGTISDDKSSIEAKMIDIALEAPKRAKPTAAKNRATGPLTVKDGKATLKIEDQTIEVKTTDKTKIMAQTAIKKTDLKVGDLVQVMSRKAKDGGEETIASIVVQPPAPERKGKGGQNAKAGGTKAGGKKGGAKKTK